MTLQIVRDWILKFNSHGPEEFLNRKAPGQPSGLKDEHSDGAHADDRERGQSRPSMASCAGASSICANMGFEEFRIHVAPQRMNRELHAMGYRKLSARPRHYAQADNDARRLFKAPTGC